MDGAGLSDHERRTLGEIEDGLKADRSLGLLLRSLDLRCRTARTAALLGAVSLALLIAASVTVAQPLIWAFAAAWVLTLVTALPLLVRWCRRRWQSRARA
ncbi:DUF3040 domain-containing protein [Streptomyces sp. NBC_00096]|uniref:DUF3040 domain-containing protein n=1 Tax=Streptomyces sp. NBC_00096 TaxID=2975650 RepID=UPI003248E2B1